MCPVQTKSNWKQRPFCVHRKSALRRLLGKNWASAFGVEQKAMLGTPLIPPMRASSSPRYQPIGALHQAGAARQEAERRFLWKIGPSPNSNVVSLFDLSPPHVNMHTVPSTRLPQPMCSISPPAPIECLCAHSLSFPITLPTMRDGISPPEE